VSLGDEMDRGERGLGHTRAAVVTGPDGSLYYDSHPLPGMPGGGARQPELGWGPEFGGEGYHFRHGGRPRRRPNGLAAGLVVLGGLAVLMIVAALVLRESDQATVSPVAHTSQATATSGQPDDGTPSSEPTDRPSRDGAQTVAADAFYSTGPQASVIRTTAASRRTWVPAPAASTGLTAASTQQTVPTATHSEHRPTRSPEPPGAAQRRSSGGT
jgi:hypothetical protein